MVYDRNVNEVLEFGTERNNESWFEEGDFACSIGGYRTARIKKSNGRDYKEEVLAIVYDLEEGSIASFDGTMARAKEGKEVYAIHLKTESFGRWFAADGLEEALDFARKLHDANIYELDY